MPSGIHIPRKYTAKSTKSHPPESYIPTEGPSRPHHLSKANPRKPRPLVYFADGETLTQTPGLPPVPGQIGFAGDRPQDGLIRPHPIKSNDEIGEQECSMQDLMFMHTECEMPEPNVSRHRRWRQNQATRWLDDIIPTLVQPYMKLVRTTQSFRLDPPVAPQENCSCQNLNERNLTIIVIRFYGELFDTF